MKTITLLLLSALFALTSAAKDVTQAQAQKIAENFLKSPAGPNRIAPSVLKPLKLAYTAANTDGKKCFYVFNNDAANGFVIVSADDRASAILGYSDTGTFDYDKLPAHIKNWFTGYIDQITYIRNSKTTATAEENNILDKEVKPLLGDIQWNQDSPYNDMCPVYDLNSRCATGCVATAMAQVMYYHKWPEQGKGSHTYMPSILNGGSLTADFGSTSYVWNDMLPKYDDSSSDASREAVAQLMLHCGIAVDMEYSISSGATSESVPFALYTYFNYDKGIAYRTRTNYGCAEWDDIIINEIDNGRPIVALGRSSAGGHAFVFDGYDRNGLIHVNWGWGGMSNGYFRTSALEPSSQGIGGSTGGFNYDQYIITGIQRPQADSETDIELISTEGLVASEETVDNGATLNFRLCGMLANAGWQDANYTYGLMLTDAEGNTLKVIDTGMNGRLPVGYQIVGPQFDNISLETLNDGTYTLYPVCRVQDGKGNWNRIRSEYVGYANYIYVNVENGKQHFSYPNYFNLDATDMTVPSEVYSGIPAEVKATITNNGDVDYLGEVMVSIVDKDTKRSVTDSDPYKIDLKPGASIDLSLVSAYNLSEGVYSLTIVDDDNRRIASFSDITVKPAPAEAAVVEPASQLSFADNNCVDRMSMDITTEVKCSDGVFGGWLCLFLFNESGAVQMGSLEPQYLFLTEGETKSVSFGGQFENGVPGKTYTACLMLYDGNTYSFMSPIEMSVCQFKLDATTSVNGIEAGSNEPVTIYDINGVRLPNTDVNSLPEGIYILRQGSRTVKIVK